MLSDIEFQEFQTSLFTPNIKATYSDFQLISEATTFKVFQAKSKDSFQFHTIRVLDIESKDVKQNRDNAVTLFLQEVLRVCITQPELVIIEEFEISEEKIAFVTKPYTTLQNLAKEANKVKELQLLKAQINVERLLKNASSDLDFLLNKMRLESISMELINIYQNKETGAYFLADWNKFTSKAPTFQRLSSAIETKRQAQKNFSQEVSKLGSMLLVLHGVDPKYLKALVEANKSTELNNVIDGLNISEALKKLLKRMFSKDLNSRPTLGELINLPISSQVNQPEEHKKADDVGQQKDGKDENGNPFLLRKL